jgi:hypothetical protein
MGTALAMTAAGIAEVPPGPDGRAREGLMGYWIPIWIIGAPLAFAIVDKVRTPSR